MGSHENGGGLPCGLAMIDSPGVDCPVIDV